MLSRCQISSALTTIKIKSDCMLIALYLGPNEVSHHSNSKHITNVNELVLTQPFLRQIRFIIHILQMRKLRHKNLKDFFPTQETYSKARSFTPVYSIPVPFTCGLSFLSGELFSFLVPVVGDYIFL